MLRYVLHRYCFNVFLLPIDLMEVVAWLLHPNPDHRATVGDMERDPWVWQPIDIENYVWEEVLPNSGNVWATVP